MSKFGAIWRQLASISALTLAVADDSGMNLDKRVKFGLGMSAAAYGLYVTKKAHESDPYGR